MRMAIFTLGVDSIRLEKMEDYVQGNWQYVGKYNDEKRLLHDAKKNFFKYLIVIDMEALSKNAIDELTSLGVEVISFFDHGRLELRLRAEREKIKELEHREKEMEQKTKMIRDL